MYRIISLWKLYKLTKVLSNNDGMSPGYDFDLFLFDNSYGSLFFSMKLSSRYSDKYYVSSSKSFFKCLKKVIESYENNTRKN